MCRGCSRRSPPRWARRAFRPVCGVVVCPLCQTGSLLGWCAVAIAYVMQKVPYVFPIVGGRKVEHLHANLEALDIALTETHIHKIESAVPFEAGAPHNLTVSPQRGKYPACGIEADDRGGDTPRATERSITQGLPTPASSICGLSARRSAQAGLTEVHRGWQVAYRFLGLDGISNVAYTETPCGIPAVEF